MAFVGELRPYQKEAFDRMVEEETMIVAYDMGLGKTPTTIAVLEKLLEDEEVRAGIIVAPASLKYQWMREIHKFTEGALVLVIDGTPAQRQKQYAIAHKYEYVIINYEQVINDWKYIKELEQDFVVLDEATKISNPKTKRTKGVKKMKPTFRYALTGQPLENRAEEVWSIGEWVDETVLGRYDIYDKTFIKRNKYTGKVIGIDNAPLLHSLLEEMMVRKKRTDPDVAPFLPAVEEEIYSVDFEGKARTLYRQIAGDLLQYLYEMKASTNFDLAAHYGQASGNQNFQQLGDIMSRFSCLAMLCTNPGILLKSAQRWEETKDLPKTQRDGSRYAHMLWKRGDLDGLPTQAPKTHAALELIEEIVTASPVNKVVLFSFYKDMLYDLKAQLRDRLGYKAVLFTGDMNAKQKDQAKLQFQFDSMTKVFLSSDAGGYGVDLPQANYLINADLPWSAGKWDQRNARIIRLSSEFDSVNLIHILMRGSIEERQYETLEEKRLIASAVVDGKGADKQGKITLSMGTLREFLERSEV